MSRFVIIIEAGTFLVAAVFSLLFSPERSLTFGSVDIRERDKAPKHNMYKKAECKNAQTHKKRRVPVVLQVCSCGSATECIGHTK